MIQRSLSREAILGNIAGARQAKTEADPAAEYACIPRAYTRSGSLDSAGRLQMLEHRLLEYDAGVYHAALDSLAKTVAEILAARGKSRIAIPRGLPSGWLPPGFSFSIADDCTARELDGFDGLLSGCTVAIALTGTLVLQNAPAQGPRKLSLVPDYLLCIVPADAVVETVPEGFARLEKSAALPTTLISGPSATADIEMTRIKGVHGPRFLDVVLLA